MILITARTGSRCLSNNQCASGAECVQGACRCPVGTELTRFGFCMPHATGVRLRLNGHFHLFVSVPPGADCGNGEQCGGGSTCAGDNICACPPGRSAIINNRCVPPTMGKSIAQLSCAILTYWPTLCGLVCRFPSTNRPKLVA
jgi:hypothetical protein